MEKYFRRYGTASIWGANEWDGAHSKRWLRAPITEVCKTPTKIQWYWEMFNCFWRLWQCVSDSLAHIWFICPFVPLLPVISNIFFLLLHFHSLFLSVIFNPITLHRVIKAVSAFTPLGNFYLSKERENPLQQFHKVPGLLLRTCSLPSWLGVTWTGTCSAVMLRTTPNLQCCFLALCSFRHLCF